MELELRDIEKSFGTNKVLDGITIKASGGYAFGLLGRNGAGKTTTIRILMDVIPADRGEVLIDGKKISYKDVKIGYLPEERGLYPKKTIIDQLIYFAMLHGMSRQSAIRSIDSWLNRIDMYQYRNKKLDTLSKGNQQKIQLVTALCHDPDIIILDEPFSGLDPVNAMMLKDIVKDQIGKGKIVLFSSHQMNYIEEFCDDIAILNNGKIAVSGNIEKIKRDYPRDKIVISSPENDIIADSLGERVVGEKKNEIIVRLDRPEDKREFMKDIIDRYDVDEMKVFEPSLNDIFVDYAKDNDGEDE